MNNLIFEKLQSYLNNETNVLKDTFKDTFKEKVVPKYKDVIKDHDFIELSGSATIFSTFTCAKCSAVLSFGYDLWYENKSVSKFGIILTCEEQIIKNIIE